MNAVSGNFTGLLDNHRVLRVEIITLALICPSTLFLSGIQFVGPAFESALNDIKIIYPHLNVSHRIVTNHEANCGMASWFDNYENTLSEFYFKSYDQRKDEFDLTALLMTGPDDASGVEKLANEENKILMTSVANKGHPRYSNWITTTISSMPAYFRVYESMVHMFNWTDLVLLLDGRNAFQLFAADYIAKRIEAMQYCAVTKFTLETARYRTADYEQLLRNISEISRVVLYFASWSSLQDLLAVADSLNMTNGEYVFIGVLAFRFPSTGGSFPWITGDSTGNATQSAFRGFLLIENLPDPGSDMAALHEYWKRLSKTKYNYTYNVHDPVPPYADSTYAALMALAEVTDELRLEGRLDTLKNGRALAQSFANRTFALKTGNLTFNERGERVPRVAVTQTDVITGKIRIIMQLHGESGELRMSNKPGFWPSLWPVPNRPKCGFLGDKCPNAGMSLLTIYVASAFVGLLVILVVAGAVGAGIYYNRFRHQENHWQLDCEAMGPCRYHAYDLLERSYMMLQVSLD